MKYPYYLYLIIVCLVFGVSSSAAGKAEFDFNVFVLEDFKDNNVEVYGVFSATEGEYGAIELVFYDEGYNYSMRAIEDVQDMAQKLKNDNIVMSSDNVLMIVNLFLKPTIIQNQEIKLAGIIKKYANVRESGKPLFEYSERKLDFVQPNKGEIQLTIKSAIPDKSVRLKITVQSSGMATKDTGADDITFETEYSLYNISDSRYEIRDKKCKLELVTNGRDKKLVCSHRKIFKYQDDDSLLYSISYEIPEVKRGDNGMLTLTFNISRTYAINPSFDTHTSKGADMYSYTSGIDGEPIYTPADIASEKMIITSFSKAITVQRGERTEIEIPADKDSPLPFESVETIVLYNPDEFVPVDIMPEMIFSATPVYPPPAQKNGIESSVWIKAYVDKSGVVRDAKILKCDRPGHGFEETALAAAYENKFKPAVRDDKPVALWITYSVNFTLGDK